MPLSDRIYYTPTLVPAAQQALLTSEAGKVTVLILSCAITITFSLCFLPTEPPLGIASPSFFTRLSLAVALASPAAPACSVALPNPEAGDHQRNTEDRRA